MRIALGLQYDGSKFSGWQEQIGQRTVQSAVEKALSQVADQEISVICAGRTDTGVHAVSQIIHFDTTANRDKRAWILGVNDNLPKDVSVTWSQIVSENFDARFSALKRHYRYIIYNYFTRSGLYRNYTTWIPFHLNENQMQEASSYLLGEHDFSSFRSAECQSFSPMRCVESIQVERVRDFVIVDIIANAFLHHMVRNIVGVLLPIGAGKKEPIWAHEVLKARDRKMAGATVSASGLYFIGAYYPDEFGLPVINRNNHIPICL